MIATTPENTTSARQNATHIVPRLLASRATWTALYVLTFATAAVVV